MNLSLGMLVVIESGVLKSPTVIIKLSIFSISFVNICFIYLGALLFDVFVFIILYIFKWVDLLHIYPPLFLITVFDWKSIFFLILSNFFSHISDTAKSWFFWWPLTENYFFLSLPTNLCVWIKSESLIGSIELDCF